MAGMSAEYINPFLVAATQILQGACRIEAKLGKPYAKEAKFTEDSVLILIGITGEMRGQVILAFPNAVACDIASRMCMMEVTQLNELSTSAICELGNMIMGNAATVFAAKGIGIDITPPSIMKGNVTISSAQTKNISIPLIYDENKTMEVNIAVIND